MSPRPSLQPGDEFATCNPMKLGAAINVVQAVQAVDNASTYTHAGFIRDVPTPDAAVSLESLWTVKSQNIFSAYAGQRILICRNIHMCPEVYVAGMEKVRHHIGQWYPFPRLLLHLMGMAKYIHWGRVVCSELVAKFEAGCAAQLGEDNYGFMRNWYGVTPDNLADRWRDSRHYHIVFEGVLGG